MNLKITKSNTSEFYTISGCEGIYTKRELLKSVIALIRANFNITDEDLKVTEERYE